MTKSWIMKRLSSLLLPLLLLMSLFSCKKDDILFQGDVTFVTAVEGVYTTDAGVQYIIVENRADREIPTEGRLILQSDILRRVEKGVYEVRVLAFSTPLAKDPVPAGNSGEADDPLTIETAWFSGGWFNALLGLYVKDESDVKHIINAEYTLPTETNDTLYLQLRHNALGDLPADPSDETDAFSYARTYACFHLNGLLPADTKVPVKILWKWYDPQADDPDACKAYDYKTHLIF